MQVKTEVSTDVQINLFNRSINKNGKEFKIDQRKSDGYVNATQLARACGKLFGCWNRLNSTKELIKALEKRLKEAQKTHYTISHNDQAQELVLIDTHVGGKSDGASSFIHPQLAIHFAKWCCPEFGIIISEWIEEYLLTGRLEMGKEMNPIELKTARIAAVNAEVDVDAQFNDREIKAIDNLSSANANLNLATFMHLSVCYIIFIDFKNGKFYFKYGRSEKIAKRLSCHVNELKATKIISICEVMSGVWVEEMFKAYLKKEEIVTTYGNEEGKHYEIFATSSKTKSIMEVVYEFNKIALQKSVYTKDYMIINNLDQENQMLKQKITDQADTIAFLKSLLTNSQLPELVKEQTTPVQTQIQPVQTLDTIHNIQSTIFQKVFGFGIDGEARFKVFDEYLLNNPPRRDEIVAKIHHRFNINLNIDVSRDNLIKLLAARGFRNTALSKPHRLIFVFNAEMDSPTKTKIKNWINANPPKKTQTLFVDNEKTRGYMQLMQEANGMLSIFTPDFRFIMTSLDYRVGRQSREHARAWVKK